MPRYQWSVERRRYVNAETGRAVSARQLNSWVRQTVENAADGMAKVAEGYNKGKLNEAEFMLEMADLTKNAHRSMTILARGGVEQMRFNDWARLGAEVRSQNAYLARFAGEITTGDIAPAEITARSRLYASSSYGTYQNAVAVREREAGARRVRRVLAAGDSCEGCRQDAARGWVDISEMRGVGEFACGPNDRCTHEYEMAEA